MLQMSKKIKELEKSALAEKPWQLSGEVTAQARPENSLLEEDVDFEQMSRTGLFLRITPKMVRLSVWLWFLKNQPLFSLAPAVTEETTLQLEDIIKQRIKDQVTGNVLWKDLRWSLFVG